MKRYTMTPISRKMQKIPVSNSKNTSNPRHSIATDYSSKRDIRMCREANYKKQCADNVYKFLSENNFEGGLSQKLLQNPSNKDFINMFKFIFSFIDDYEYSNKFEEDVVNILKILKYPYSSEINKSQLTAITPHIWPILLSMLSWLIDLMLNVENQNEESIIDQNVESLFYDFVSNGYSKYLQGEDDDDALENEFESKVQELYSELFKEIDNKKTILKDLESEIENIKSGFSGLEVLEQKKTDLLDDLNSLISSQKQLENKKIKYYNNIKKITEEISNIENEVNDLKNIKEDLLNKIDAQKINPKDVKIMNKEKVDLYKELEKITPVKEKFMINNKEMEKKLSEYLEEIERLIFDFNNISDEKINIEKDQLIFNRELDEVKEILDTDYNEKIEKLEKLKTLQSATLESKEEKENILKEIEYKIEFNQNKLLSTGEIYLKKKTSSEEEQKKNNNQMEKLERELLQLTLESNSSFIQSEQALQKAQITYDMITNKCKQEKEAIKNLVFKFYNNMENFKNGMQRINDKLMSLRNYKEF